MKFTKLSEIKKGNKEETSAIMSARLWVYDRLNENVDIEAICSDVVEMAQLGEEMAELSLTITVDPHSGLPIVDINGDYSILEHKPWGEYIAIDSLLDKGLNDYEIANEMARQLATRIQAVLGITDVTIDEVREGEDMVLIDLKW